MRKFLSGNLGATLWLQGRFTEAEPLYEEALAIKRRVVGEEHEDTLGAITNLGMVYNSTACFEEAAEMFAQSLPIKRRVLPPHHPWIDTAIQGLATAYEGLGRHDDALPLRRELLERQLVGATGLDATAEALNAAAWTLLTHDIEALRDPARALTLAQRACTAEEAANGSDLWSYLDTLALAQHRTGDTKAAVATQRRALSLMPEVGDPEVAQRLAEYEAALKKD